MGRALIYTRVSHDQAGGRSPAEQEAEARAWCQREGHEVTHVVTDSVGASRHSRGRRVGWEQVSARLASGEVDLLVTWEASRAQRDLAAYAALRDLCVEHKVRWAYSGHVHDLATSEGRFRTGLDALLAERAADETSDRVRRSMRGKAARGEPHGSPRLFGYRRVYDSDTGSSRWEPDPTEAETVRSMFRSWLAGHSTRTIAEQLAADGVVGTRGRPFTAQSVRRGLSNPAYAGLRVHRGEVVGPAAWPALVDRDTWERSEARYQGVRWRQLRRDAHLLTGIARCATCTAKLAVRRGPRRPDGTRRLTYTCDRCYNSRDHDRLDEWVALAVLDRLRDPATRTAAAHGTAPQVTEARTRAAAAHAELAEAMALWKARRLTVAAYAEMEATLTARIAQAERDERSAALPIDIDLPDDIDEIAAWWDAKTTAEQREILAAYVTAVIVSPVGRGRRNYRTADYTTIEWRRG